MFLGMEYKFLFQACSGCYLQDLVLHFICCSDLWVYFDIDRVQHDYWLHIINSGKLLKLSLEDWSASDAYEA